ncbi:MAG TPA: hypothetical protein VHL08_01800 [Dongiaceae bacterium]|nr:hypothetical protein [Dongiaceae bacterium]
MTRLWQALLLLSLVACAGPAIDGKSCSVLTAEMNPLFDIPTIGRLPDSLSPAIHTRLGNVEGIWNIDSGASFHARFVDDREAARVKQKAGSHQLGEFWADPDLSPLHLGTHDFPLENSVAAINMPNNIGTRDLLAVIKGLISPQQIGPDIVTILDNPRHRFLGFRSDLAHVMAWYRCQDAHAPHFHLVARDPRYPYDWLVPMQLSGHKSGLFLIDTGADTSEARRDMFLSPPTIVAGLAQVPINGKIYYPDGVRDAKVEILGMKRTIPLLDINGDILNQPDFVDGIIGIDVLKDAVLIIPWYGVGRLAIGFPGAP